MSTYSWQNFVLVEWQALQEKIESTKKEWETLHARWKPKRSRLHCS